MDELRALVGPQVYDADGGLNKPVLAAYLCQGRHYSQQVDRIVHPRVAQAFGQFCAAQPSATNANLHIHLQLSESEKMARADAYIVNE